MNLYILIFGFLFLIQWQVGLILQVNTDGGELLEVPVPPSPQQWASFFGEALSLSLNH